MECGQGIRFQSFNALPEMPVRLYWTAGKSIWFPVNRHPEIEIQYIRHSHGEYLVDGVRTPFWPNSLLVFPPYITHSRHIDPGIYIKSVGLVFSFKLLQRETPALKVADLPRCTRLSMDEGVRVESLMRLISKEIQDRTDNWRDNVIRALGFLAVLISRWRGREKSWPKPNPAVQKATAYIEAHYAENITLPAMASHLNMSPTHLSRVFNREIRMGIRAYVIQQRIAEAARLLQEKEEHKIEWVARSVGYRDYRLFYRHFTQFLGKSPVEYRPHFMKPLTATKKSGLCR